MKTQIMKAVFGIVTRNEKSYWTQIGMAFATRDGSWNIKLDFLPSNLATTTIQLRDLKPRREKALEEVSDTATAGA